jgi:hypothetical protein
MGRYYNGDINGKFWFGVQPSDDANFFGVSASEPSEIFYCFCKENLKDVEKGIKKCLKALGKNKEELDNFFKKNDCYNEKQITEETSIKTIEEVAELLSWYARLELGIKIRDCIKENGSCEFSAEL